ncbi:MAG: LysM peptidoglycan-binding domain-containing protein, partial [Chloroflexota bacterium]
MNRSSKFYSAFVALLVVFLLGACQLQRENADVANPGVLSDASTPTLAPLGADDTEVAVEGDVNPTVIDVEPTATASSLGAGEATNVIGSEPTSQPVDLAGTAEEQAPVVEESAAADAIELPAAEPASSTEPIIVNATSSEELPVGGPVAVDPPASETVGDYGTSATISYDNSQGNYRVQAGDTLFNLSLAYDTTVEALIALNGLSSADVIYEGQLLVVPGADNVPSAPAPDGTHIVAEGETLFSIAIQYDTSVEALEQVN